MNQDKVKNILLGLESDVPDFAVIFSGKKSRKVDGLYKPEPREIIIHNRNFENDNDLIYTAIHEYAHHLQFSGPAKPISSRAHTGKFWSIFHSLLKKAEEIRVWENVFSSNDEFIKLTDTIRTQFLAKNGGIMKEFGKVLIKAKELCDKYKASFFDYIERVLSLPRASAKIIMKAYHHDINPGIGFDNMKTVARINDREKRVEAENAILKGESPYIVKSNYLAHQEEELTPIESLRKEKTSIEKRIQSLKERLILVQNRIEELKDMKTKSNP